MDRPAFRGFVVMRMKMGVGEHGVHLVPQYTNVSAIWQAL